MNPEGYDAFEDHFDQQIARLSQMTQASLRFVHPHLRQQVLRQIQRQQFRIVAVGLLHRPRPHADAAVAGLTNLCVEVKSPHRTAKPVTCLLLSYAKELIASETQYTIHPISVIRFPRTADRHRR